MSDSDDTGAVLGFPCAFPIKVMGRIDGALRESALRIIERHAGSVAADAVRSVPSSRGNFLSLTITIEAQSRQQLDDIYRELSAHDDVLVAL